MNDCIKSFLSSEKDKYGEVLVTVYTTSTDIDFIKRMSSKIREEITGSRVIGCVTAYPIWRGGLRTDCTVLSFNAFEKSHIEVFCYEGEENLVGDGREFCEKASNIKNLAAVEIIATLRILDIQPFLDNFTKIDNDVVIFGGGANTLREGSAFVFSDDNIIDKGIVCACYSGEELHVKASLNFGWKPLGREFVITKMEGVHTIVELDHEPAISVYEKYLGITGDEHFHHDTLVFPIFVRRGNDYIARHPVGYRDDGSLEFIADLHEGEHIRLAYGDPGEMIDDAKAGISNMAEFNPQGIEILNCLAHRMFLKDDVKFELESCNEVAPSYGFYTYGEIFRFVGSVGVHNMMILMVGFREGEKPDVKIEIKRGAPSRLQDSLLLVQRLVRFVGATTSELENANTRLDMIARTDRLTSLSNRGETENILKKSIAASAQNDLPLSVLMLDIDNFKSVNDVYGHDIGDKVLVAASKVLRENIRPGDTAGRWGGEEFLMIFPDTDGHEALLIAEKIRKEISELEVLPDRKRFTASFGVARIAPGELFDNFYKRVDNALYDAKHSGKNCVRTSEKKNNNLKAELL